VCSGKFEGEPGLVSMTSGFYVSNRRLCIQYNLHSNRAFPKFFLAALMVIIQEISSLW
jgi:hypothetical protein